MEIKKHEILPGASESSTSETEEATKSTLKVVEQAQSGISGTQPTGVVDSKSPIIDRLVECLSDYNNIVSILTHKLIHGELNLFEPISISDATPSEQPAETAEAESKDGNKIAKRELIEIVTAMRSNADLLKEILTKRESHLTDVSKSMAPAADASKQIIEARSEYYEAVDDLSKARAEQKRAESQLTAEKNEQTTSAVKAANDTLSSAEKRAMDLRNKFFNLLENDENRKVLSVFNEAASHIAMYAGDVRDFVGAAIESVRNPDSTREKDSYFKKFSEDQSHRESLRKGGVDSYSTKSEASEEQKEEFAEMALKLADAKSRLADAKSKLADAESKLADDKSRLADAEHYSEKESADKERMLEKAKSDVALAKEERDSALSDVNWQDYTINEFLGEICGFEPDELFAQSYVA
jgi:hypothetical protein